MVLPNPSAGRIFCQNFPVQGISRKGSTPGKIDLRACLRRKILYHIHPDDATQKQPPSRGRRWAAVSNDRCLPSSGRHCHGLV